MNVQAPFGGKKASGIGREFGEYVSFMQMLSSSSRITCTDFIMAIGFTGIY